MKSEIQSIETKTLEEVLLELRTKNNWTYLNIMDKLNEKGKYVEEKIIKKWEIGLIYPTTDELYLLSEIYMYQVTNLIQAKTNSYKKGMDAMEEIESASGTYGRFEEAVKKIDPRKE